MTGADPSRARDGRPDLTPSNLRRIAEIVQVTAGIALGDRSDRLIVSRLSKHLRRLELDGFDPYVALVTSDAGASERRRMIHALTTNTTSFYREAAHFAILESQIVPRLERKARAGGRVRIWSAACSTGEEPYSIAATLLSAFPDAARFDVRILATDINDHVLARAEAGFFDAATARGLSPAQRAALFETDAAAARPRVRQALRDLVCFRYLNFMEPWPVSGPFDAIFCRNVAIYMDRPTQMHLWAGLERVLDDDGVLFIGHSERIGPHLSHRLELFGPTTFRRPRAATAPHPLNPELENVSV